MTGEQTIESTDPDLILVVVREALGNGQKALRFYAKTRGSELNLKPFLSPSFQKDPEEHFAELFRDVEQSLGLQHEDWLAGRGAQLCEELLPEKLRSTLWELRGKVRTLQILSDEVWIPWELLRLQDPDDPGSGPFLVEAFSVTRWLIGVPSVFDLPLRQIALVAPRDSILPSVPAELELMRSLASPGRAVVEIPARSGDVTDALASGEYEGFHFAGHGSEQPGGRYRGGLLLEDSTAIEPAHLFSRARRFGRAHPLVFLNACHSGRGVASLTGLGGLASAFINAGAGAFIGSHWELKDTQASAFAEEIYPRLLAGMEIGEAVRAARLALRDRFPGGHGWLMYTVFAHPLARCTTPLRPVADEEPAPAPRSMEASLLPPETPAPGDEWINEKDGTVLVWIPGREETSPFWIGKLLVTNEQYARFLEENPEVPAPAFWDAPRFNQPRHPVVGVSWDEARAYCDWAGLDLPTEEEAEAAVRGDDRRPHPWGPGLPTPLHANFDALKGGTTAVDAYAAGRGPYGTFDQAGNVWEWCAAADPGADPGERDEAVRPLRGGAWNSPAEDLHASTRYRGPARRRLNSVGFRCVWRPR